MSAYRCTTCSTNWPTTNDFKTCPECGDDQKTWLSTSNDPIPVDEAKSRLLHAQFETYYADHCAKQLNDELDRGAA